MNGDALSDAERLQLQALWQEGLTLTSIGERMARSKNSICGHVHRLKLPPRPSPIRRGETAKPVPVKRPRDAVKLPALPSCVEPVAVKPPPSAKPQPRVSNASCSWPIGDPGTTGFRFCEASALVGRPYCADHCAQAYMPKGCAA